MKVAVVHEYLTAFGGAERVLLDILEVFPQSDLFVLTYEPRRLPQWVQNRLARHKIFVSQLNKVKKIVPLVRLWAPYAVEGWDLSGYDLVISNSNSYAKGVIAPTEVPHISYIHSPTRYLWDYAHLYQKEHFRNKFSLALWRVFAFFQRRWDFIASQRPDVPIANSVNVQKRISKYYRRQARVLYPAIRWDKYFITKAKEDYFLVVSRLSPYKKVDLVVKTFLSLKDQKLKVVGEGQEMKHLQKIARGAKNIEFLGFVPDRELRKIYARALAVIFPQVEDFGLVPVEAMASGTPIIAYKKGGVLETVSQATGVFFEEQTERALKKAIREFLAHKQDFGPEELRKEAQRFDFTSFKKGLLSIVEDVLAQKRKAKN